FSAVTKDIASRLSWARAIGGCVLAALGMGAAAGPAQATEYSRFEWLWLDPAAGVQASVRQGALLNLPASWQAGDAVVVLGSDGPGQASPLSALLHAGTAVLELNQSPHQPANALAEAALALRQQRRAGLLIAVGQGGWGDALRDAALPQAYAATISLGEGLPHFAMGATPVAAAERWEMRAPLLCETLRWAQEAAATPLPPASVTGAELEARCRAGLLPAPRPRVLSAAR
ncbi:MAG: hypothetical protein WCP77_23140, partial [Roseococcus sp.]